MATSKDKRIIEFTELYNPVASIVWIKEVIIPPAQEIKSKISENKTTPYIIQIKENYLRAYPLKKDFIKYMSIWVKNPKEETPLILNNYPYNQQYLTLDQSPDIF